jgi:hypothetical protein
VQRGGGGWSANVFFAFCKKCDRKNNRRVDCAEADKKTVQAQRYEGRGFLAAGGCPAELPVINFQAMPALRSDNFILAHFTKMCQLDNIYPFSYKSAISSR